MLLRNFTFLHDQKINTVKKDSNMDPYCEKLGNLQDLLLHVFISIQGAALLASDKITEQTVQDFALPVLNTFKD